MPNSHAELGNDLNAELENDPARPPPGTRPLLDVPDHLAKLPRLGYNLVSLGS
jgi:hypothetical protein